MSQASRGRYPFMEQESTRELNYEVLAFCAEERRQDDVVRFALESPQSKKVTTSLSTVIDTLVKEGALVRLARIDGALVPIEEFVEAIESGDAARDDAEIVLIATDFGKQVAADGCVEKRLARMLAEKTQHKPALRLLVDLCETPQTLSSITAALKSAGVPTEPARGVEPVYPSLLLDSLQRTGVIVWEDGWRLTKEGRSIAAKWREELQSC